MKQCLFNRLNKLGIAKQISAIIPAVKIVFSTLILFITAILFITTDVEAQNLLKSPESIVYDANYDRYLISNVDDSAIVQMDREGNTSYFNTSLTGVRGMHILDNILYVASNEGVVGFKLTMGLKTFTLPIIGSSFLNDITSDGSDNLYVTDSDLSKVYKININDRTYSVLAESDFMASNGILFDASNNRLLICSSIYDSPIQAVSLDDNSLSTVVETSLDLLDGITEDNEGNIYVSSWSNNSIYRFDKNFQNPPELVASDFISPADIYFNKHLNVLAVPNLYANRIDFISFSATERVIKVPDDQPTIQQGIDAAMDGDTVLVAPGTYLENINFKGKNIIVASFYIFQKDFNFIKKTIINGSNPTNPDSASCVAICSGEDSTAILQGFTLTSGKGTRWYDDVSSFMYWRGGGGVFTWHSSPTIKNNIIIDNIVTDASGVGGAQGGGILCFSGNPLIQNNVIMSNKAHYGAGIVIDYSGARIKNNIIYKNTGGTTYGGAGFWSIGSGPAPIILENNTIVENAASGSGTYGGRGGAMFIWDGTVTIRNTIIWGNTQSQGEQIAEVDGGTAVVSYCNVQGVKYWGGGNLSLNPAFADTNFYLSENSPCVDAGNPNAEDNDPENSGRAQFPALGGLRNDMGAYGGPGSCLLRENISTLIEGKTEKNIAPERYSLGQNYPNPFNLQTLIEYHVPQNAQAQLIVYNVCGHVLRQLVNETKTAGIHTASWDGRDNSGNVMPSGVYFYRIEINTQNSKFEDVNKMILMK